MPSTPRTIAHAEIMAEFGVARQLPAGAASAPTALTPDIRGISIVATGADIRFVISATAAPVADANTSHLIRNNGERLDLRVPFPQAYIAVIRDAGVDGVLEVSELT